MGLDFKLYKHQNKDFVFEEAKNAKGECFGRSEDYKRMVLRDFAGKIVPFGGKSRQWMRKKFNEKWKGRRQWSNRPCFVCKKSACHTHHIVSLKNGGNNNEVNLIRLCRPCHEEIHGYAIPLKP